MTETFNSPLFKVKLQALIMKAAEESQGTKGKDNQAAPGTADNGLMGENKSGN